MFGLAADVKRLLYGATRHKTAVGTKNPLSFFKHISF